MTSLDLNKSPKKTSFRNFYYFFFNMGTIPVSLRPLCASHHARSVLLSPPLPCCAVGSGCEQNNINVWRHLTSPLAFRAQPNHSGPKPIGN